MKTIKFAVVLLVMLVAVVAGAASPVAPWFVNVRDRKCLRSNGDDILYAEQLYNLGCPIYKEFMDGDAIMLDCRSAVPNGTILVFTSTRSACQTVLERLDR